MCGYHSQHEHPVSTKKIVDEFFHGSVIGSGFSWVFGQNAKILLHETRTLIRTEHDQEPVERVENCYNAHCGVPEPQEEEYLLVEHIDHEDALASVPVYVSQNSHFEIAQSDPREHAGLFPVRILK